MTLEELQSKLEEIFKKPMGGGIYQVANPEIIDKVLQLDNLYFSELVKECIGEDDGYSDSPTDPEYWKHQDGMLSERNQLRKEIRERFRAKGILI